MRRRTILIVVVGVAALVSAVGYLAYLAWWHANYYVQERTDYGAPPERDELELVDDKLDDKTPALDETLVDGRPLGDSGGTSGTAADLRGRHEGHQTGGARAAAQRESARRRGETV